MLIALLILFSVALPLAWIIADLRGSATVRRTLGAIAILWSFGVAALVGSLERLNSNAYFTRASKNLLEVSVQQLRAGNTEAVLRELSRANDEFSPTYENRARYEQIARQAADGMKK